MFPFGIMQMLGDVSTSVQSIYFTEDEQVAVVTYDTGLISAYDVRGGFTWLGPVDAADSCIHTAPLVVG